MDSTLQITRRGSGESFLYSLLFLGLWFVFPVACIFLFPVLLYKFRFSRSIENLLLLLMAISFGVIAYTTKSTGTTDSDIARYYDLYHGINYIESWQQFLFVFVVDGTNNVLFYIITFIMTRIFPENPQVLPFFWVSVTYFFSFLALKEFVQYLSLSRKQFILMLFFSCVGIITFYTTTEIIKQTASVAMMCYAISLKLNHKKGSLWMAIVSLLVHFSSFLILPVYLFCKKRKVVSLLPFVFVICLALSFFNFNVLLYSILSLFLHTGSDLLMRVQTYENFETDTWSISFRFYAVFAMYFFLVLIFYWDYFKKDDTEEKKKKQSLLIIHCLAFFALLINLNNVHNFVRYVLGYFPFYMVAVAQLFYTRMVKFDKAIVISLVLAFYLYSNIKMLISQTVGTVYANSYMGNDLFTIFTSNVVQFLRFRVIH